MMFFGCSLRSKKRANEAIFQILDKLALAALFGLVVMLGLTILVLLLFKGLIVDLLERAD